MNNPKLENWSLIGSSIYIVPECQRFYLKGEVFGHLRFRNGEQVTTSYIVKVNGPLVTTHSGSVYTLCYPNAEYVEWCRENGHHVPTLREPIKKLL